MFALEVKINNVWTVKFWHSDIKVVEKMKKSSGYEKKRITKWERVGIEPDFNNGNSYISGSTI